MKTKHEEHPFYVAAIELYRAVVANSKDIESRMLDRAMRRRALSVLEHAACAAASSTQGVRGRARFLALQAATKLGAVVEALRLENDLSERAQRELKDRLHELVRTGDDLLSIHPEPPTPKDESAALSNAPFIFGSDADPADEFAELIEAELHPPLPNTEPLGP